MLLKARAEAAVAGRSVRDRSVVLLFLQGGPSHIEFFDPKMSAPAEFRSITGEVPTRLPGITFGGTFPKLARLADKLAVVRSYATGRADHTYLIPASGANALKATMGALYARVAGTNHPRTGMPNNILVLPEAVQRGLRLQGNFETGGAGDLDQSGRFGPRLQGVRSQRQRGDPAGHGASSGREPIRRSSPTIGPVRYVAARC